MQCLLIITLMLNNPLKNEKTMANSRIRPMLEQSAQQRVAQQMYGQCSVGGFILANNAARPRINGTKLRRNRRQLVVGQIKNLNIKNT